MHLWSQLVRRLRRKDCLTLGEKGCSELCSHYCTTAWITAWLGTVAGHSGSGLQSQHFGRLRQVDHLRSGV